MTIELHEPKGSGKQIVPFHTGKIAIGRAYIPKQRPQDARWIEHHTATGYGPVWWTLFGAISVVGLILIGVTA